MSKSNEIAPAADLSAQYRGEGETLAHLPEYGSGEATFRHRPGTYHGARAELTVREFLASLSRILTAKKCPGFFQDTFWLSSFFGSRCRGRMLTEANSQFSAAKNPAPALLNIELYG